MTIKWSPFDELNIELATKDLEWLAADTVRQFDGRTLVDDLIAEVWVWTGQNPVRASNWWYDNARGERKFSRRNFQRDARKVMVALCRQDKLAAEGREEEDQLGYSARQIRRYLPYVWHSEVLAAASEVNEISAKGDPAKGGDAMVSAMDVRRAYRRVITPDGRDDKILFCLYALGLTQEETAGQVDLTQSMVSRIDRQLLERLAEFLSGPEFMPGTTWRDGPGTRAKPPKGSQE